MERQNPYENPPVSSENHNSLSEIMDSVNELESLYTDEYDFDIAYTMPELFRKQTASEAPVSPIPAAPKAASYPAPSAAPSDAVAAALGANAAVPKTPAVPDQPAQEDDPELFAKTAQEQYTDSGTYLNYNGSREYRSFDAAMPDAPSEGWYHYSDESDQDEDTGNYDDYDDYEEDEYYDDEEEPPKHRGLKIFGKVVLAVLTFFSVCYLTFIYSDNLYISRLRNMYINTAMTTLSHKYLATAIIPSDIIDELLIRQWESESIMQSGGSDWGNVDVGALPTLDQEVTTGSSAHDMSDATASSEEADLDADAASGPQYGSEEERIFYEYFYELDYASASAYFKKNPQALANGWYYVDINEAGLSDSGTSILTTNGDQVLAINARQGILLIRINIGSSRGVMAICKDPERLSLRAASTLGSVGQTAGKICEANDGILSITGSAFMDDGSGNGGQISGLAVCNGTTYGDRLGGTDKRLELRTDNKMYIVNSTDSVDPNTRDACEFRPALIMDGKITVDENCGWTSPNPRAVLGQTDKLEVMMVVVEGRFLDSPGCSVVKVAELMQDYGCVQALNLDGGTSAIMYYNGEYITRCSNTDLPGGRTLPSAWVYLKK